MMDFDAQIKMDFAISAIEELGELERLIIGPTITNQFQEVLIEKKLKELSSKSKASELSFLVKMFNVLLLAQEKDVLISSDFEEKCKVWFSETREVLEVLKIRPLSNFNLSFFIQEFENSINELNEQNIEKVETNNLPDEQDDYDWIEEIETSKLGKWVSQSDPDSVREVSIDKLKFNTGKIKVLYPGSYEKNESGRDAEKLGEVGAEIIVLAEDFETSKGLGQKSKVLLLRELASKLKKRITQSCQVDFPMLDAMIVLSNDEYYLIPIDRVKGVIPGSKKLVTKVAGVGPTLKWKKRKFPILSLRQLLGDEINEKHTKNKVFILLEQGGREFALLVDSTLGVKKVLISRVGNEFLLNEMFRGVSIIDERIALILDTEEIEKGCPLFKKSRNLGETA